jgi:2-polyprenyl-6-methoxyphenol hydroxylase-like FAD-dependent oxidoreductase
MRAAIVGSGIAGLAAALALKRENVSCLVYERALQIREVGAGLSLLANGVQALNHLGVKDQVIAVSSAVNELVTMSDRGKVLDRVDFEALSRPQGSECICVQRGALQRILLQAVGPDSIHTGADCVEIQESHDHVSVRFEDSSCDAVDFVVAADGIRSTIRKQLHPHSQLRFAGYSAWRALTAGTFSGLPEGTAFLILGRGCQAGIFRCGPHRIYWFATQNAPTNPGLSADLRKLGLLKRFGHWPSPFPGVIEATPAENILENDIFDLATVNTWGIGRITFAGDAIHAMTPNLGQGAALALEDAVILARSIRKGIDIEKALREYERARRKRTAWIARASRRAGSLLQAGNPIVVLLRNWLLSTHFAHLQGERLLKEVLEFG